MAILTENWTKSIEDAISSSIETKNEILKNKQTIQVIEDVCSEIIRAFRAGKKVLFCGNGGSAADAQHLAAEFSGKFYLDREPLFSEALHVNTSYLTAVANDYSFDQVYSRLVKAKGAEGDVIIGLSTSGNSVNIIKAFEEARKLGMVTVGMTREGECAMQNVSDYVIGVPSSVTPRIQEAHITIGHVICEIVEREIFASDK
jgi:D-sedoheptulose 7-phosphate isomerase